MSLAEQLFYSTIYIETKSTEGDGTGTGFVLKFESNKGTIGLIVTNKHVLENAHTAKFRAVSQGADGSPSRKAARITVTDFNNTVWVGHPNADIDVAVMPFNTISNEMTAMGSPPFAVGFDHENLMTHAEALELDALEEVTFLGYPAGLYDTSSWLPIARRGQTASPIFNDYRNQPAFLIDAAVFPGSSGSPVFIFDRGPYVNKRQELVMRGRFYLAGILAAGHLRTVQGQIHLSRPGPTFEFNDLLDLGIVYKSSAIQECVEALMLKEGLSLVPSTETEFLA